MKEELKAVFLLGTLKKHNEWSHFVLKRFTLF